MGDYGNRNLMTGPLEGCWLIDTFDVHRPQDTDNVAPRPSPRRRHSRCRPRRRAERRADELDPGHRSGRRCLRRGPLRAIGTGEGV